jgi:hypothetical protein
MTCGVVVETIGVSVGILNHNFSRGMETTVKLIPLPKRPFLHTLPRVPTSVKLFVDITKLSRGICKILICHGISWDHMAPNDVVELVDRSCGMVERVTQRRTFAVTMAT